jgi:hypothetical protein
MAYITKIDDLAISEEHSSSDQARRAAKRLASKNPDHTVIIQKTTKTEIFIIGMCRRPHCEKCDGSGLADLALIFDSQLKA